MLPADLPLDAEELLLPLRLDALGELPVELERFRPFLARELKHAHLLEPHLLDEVAELLELLLRLTREAGDEAGPEGEVRDALADPPHQPAHPSGVTAPLHPAKHGVADVLQRHVEVASDVGLAREPVDQRFGEVARVGVVQPDPARGHLAQGVQELVEFRSTRKVVSVSGQILGDEVQLDCALGAETRGLGDDVGDRPGSLQAAEGGDDAEGALVVAAFADLHVSRPARHRIAPRSPAVGDVVRIRNHGPVALSPQDLRDARIGGGPDEVIDLRHLLLENVCVALRETTGNHQRLAAPGFRVSRGDKILLFRFR